MKKPDYEIRALIAVVLLFLFVFLVMVWPRPPQEHNVYIHVYGLEGCEPKWEIITDHTSLIVPMEDPAKGEE